MPHGRHRRLRWRVHGRALLGLPRAGRAATKRSRTDRPTPPGQPALARCPLGRDRRPVPGRYRGRARAHRSWRRLRAQPHRPPHRRTGDQRSGRALLGAGRSGASGHGGVLLRVAGSDSLDRQRVARALRASDQRRARCAHRRGLPHQGDSATRLHPRRGQLARQCARARSQGALRAHHGGRPRAKRPGHVLRARDCACRSALRGHLHALLPPTRLIGARDASARGHVRRPPSRHVPLWLHHGRSQARSDAHHRRTRGEPPRRLLRCAARGDTRRARLLGPHPNAGRNCRGARPRRVGRRMRYHLRFRLCRRVSGDAAQGITRDR